MIDGLPSKNMTLSETVAEREPAQTKTENEKYKVLLISASQSRNADKCELVNRTDSESIDKVTNDSLLCLALSASHFFDISVNALHHIMFSDK